MFNRVLFEGEVSGQKLLPKNFRKENGVILIGNQFTALKSLGLFLRGFNHGGVLQNSWTLKTFEFPGKFGG